MSDFDTVAALDALQLEYIRTLDVRDMAAWADCFDADSASYICIARENVEQQLPLALMMDDSHARIRDRANCVTKVWAGTFEDYTTRHFVQRLAWHRVDGDVVAADSNFMVAYTSAKGRSEILVAGSYQDRITFTGAGPRFRSKRAVLDTVTTPRYLVYPV